MPPRIKSAAAIARAIMPPFCTGPVPMASMIRSATASPTATPKIHSVARLSVCPAIAPIEITAAIAATNGRSCPNTNVATDQARVAATAVCTTGQKPIRNRPNARSMSLRTTKNPPCLAPAKASKIATTPPSELTRLNYVLMTHTLMTNLTRLARQATCLITLSRDCYQVVAKLLPSDASAGWRRTNFREMNELPRTSNRRSSENFSHAKFAEWRLSEEYPMPLFKTECSQSLPLSPISPSPSRYQPPSASLLDPTPLPLGFLQELY